MIGILSFMFSKTGGILISLVLVVGIVSYGWNEWSNMKIDNANKELAISALHDTIKVVEELAEDNTEAAVANAISNTKKKYIEEGISYDKNGSVDINSTRIYF